MSRNSNAYKLLCALYRNVLCRMRDTGEQIGAVAGTARRRVGPVESLEQRVMLDGTGPLTVPDLVLQGGVGDIVAIDLNAVALSDQYRLVGAELSGEGWALDLQPHGSNYRLVRNGSILAELISPQSLGGKSFASTGRLYLLPSLANALPGDNSIADLGFQGMLRLSMEAGEPASALPIDVAVTIGAGASANGPNIPIANGESAVLRAQQRLNYLDAEYSVAVLNPVETTGVLDVPTQGAVQAFQALVGMAADGKLGEQTASRLATYPEAPTTIAVDQRQMLQDAMDAIPFLGGGIERPGGPQERHTAAGWGCDDRGGRRRRAGESLSQCALPVCGHPSRQHRRTGE